MNSVVEEFIGEKNESGSLEGVGTHKDQYGNVYVGNFVNGMKQGQGTLTRSNGDVFDGEWDKNEMVSGKFTSPGGDVYEGGFRWLKFQGQGKLVARGQPSGEWPHYCEYEGNFHCGQFWGQGVFKYNNSEGDVFTGRWLGGKRNGPGRIEGERTLIEGDWVDDEFQSQDYRAYIDRD